ncbi:MAG TPA: LuxR C-terminal-related transcriptional regulator [Polyangiaceae bacterium]|nr:LuxR C-terminal-related transcriptional regulator [Polyangiaceae bacterium]
MESSSNIIAERGEPHTEYAVEGRGDGSSADASDFPNSACAEAWAGLASGRSIVVESRTTRLRTHLVIANAGLNAYPPRARDLRILERLLLGESAKSLAIELKLSQSTIATALKRTLEGMGLKLLPSRLPLGLAVLVHHAHGRAAVAMQRHLDPNPHRLVLSARFASLDEMLSPAVLDVVFQFAQGSSHAEIAAHRRTSTRTVANQIAMAFQRLGVSGRTQLLEYLVFAPISKPQHA